jgi:hypothetical protein
MPPIKELHYFSRELRATDNYLPNDSLGQPYRFWEPQVRAWWGEVRAQARRSLRRHGMSRPWLAEMRWIRRYFFGSPKNMAWYRSLFAPAAGRMCGEITPAYSLLDDATIGEIHRELPDLKLIFRMRDPIDRALSQQALFAKLGQIERNATEQQQLAFLTSPAVQGRGDYLAILRRWQKHYPAEQIFVGWFEELAEDSTKAFHRVLDFLNLPSAEAMPLEPLAKRFNSHQRVATPPSVIRGLARHMRPQIAALADHFGHHAVRWLAHCDELLSGWAGDPVGSGRVGRRDGAQRSALPEAAGPPSQPDQPDQRRP